MGEFIQQMYVFRISKITECVNFAEEVTKKFGLRAPMVGHLGDGNFHVVLPYDPQKKETYNKIREFSDLLIKKTLRIKRNNYG